jgi:acetyltransferase-like isoleucine patch superfamily enzyme
VTFGDLALVRDGVWIKADGTFVAGEEITIGPGGAIHCTDRIELDDLVGIGERVSIIDSDHTFDGTDDYYMRKPLKLAPVRLERQTMVAFGSIVLKGARIGRNSVVAANAVVRGGEYEPGSVIAGNPATVVKILGADAAGASDERPKPPAG